MDWKRITITYIVVCVSKCWAMSRNELEDFVEFIQKTSHLDEPLIWKKGTRPGDEFDEDEAVSEHAWEDSGKFEGDLILNERQRRLIIQDVAEGLARNGLTDTTKRWPNHEVIYYIQKEHFSSDQVQAIQDGIDDLARASCVKFRPYRKGDRDAVVVQGSRRGCFSQVGYQGGYQVLNLSGRHPVGRGCFRHGTVVHEFLHTLGFFHMQSSPDRDDYIEVLWQNIIQPAKHNFRKYNTFSVSDFGVGYDYDSVLHYSRKAFSSNGGDTLVPKQGGASIGQRIGLSDKDVKKLNKMYCDADSDSHDESKVDLNSHSKVPETISNTKSKNKPFTGHGIGYHQGKTVVIQLPAADTYKLTDLPTFHMFDYFSKTPQTMSPPTFTEGLRVGKEINYNYVQPAIDYYKSPFVSEEYKNIVQNKNEEEEKTNNKKIINDEKTHKKTAPEIEQSSDGEDYNIDEAFERLGKLIKSQVYPSHERLYDHREREYSTYLRPLKMETSQSGIENGNDHFSVSPHLNNMSEKKTDEYLSQQFIKGLSDSRRQEEPQDENKESAPAPFNIPEKTILSEKVDSSFGTPFPSKEIRMVNNGNIVTPEYQKLKNLRYKHNFSRLYNPFKEDTRDTAFIRADAPSSYMMSLDSESQEKENTENDNNKNNVYEYTYRPSQDKAFALRPGPQGFKLQLKSDHKNIHLPSDSKPAYKLYGVLVPITQNWFKIDYDTHQGDYSRDTYGSSEDHG